jgi:hypothetical protein
MDEYVLIATNTDPEPKDQPWLAWGTLREINWLTKIGEHAGDTIKDDRLTLLKKYQASMTKRGNWGTMDSRAIAQAVKVMIRDAKRKS